MKKIKKICITGGTCGGKTKTFEKLKDVIGFDKYKDLKVIYIPESATELMSRGISPSNDYLGDNFQIINLKNQLRREELALEAAMKMEVENILIVCDRSSYEQQVFVDSSLWNSILFELALSNEILRDSYDAVFHLVSSAVGAEMCFGFETNEYRIHSLEQAKEQELKAQELWRGCKNFRIYPNEINFMVKIDKVINDILKFIEESFYSGD